jgi:hypothetical protein
VSGRQRAVLELANPVNAFVEANPFHCSAVVCVPVEWKATTLTMVRDIGSLKPIWKPA